MKGEDSGALVRAYALAAAAHAGQTRKTGAPYVNHCCEVALLVSEAGAPVPTVIAAVLHDVVEKTETTEAEVGAAFGATVAGLVAALTDPPVWEALPRAEAKARQAERMRRAEPEARRIKVADQTAKLREIAREPEAWDDAAGAIEGAELVVAACRGVDPALDAAFDTAAAEAMAKIGGAG